MKVDAAKKVAGADSGQTSISSEVACSSEVDAVESTSSPIDPGWPPAEPKAHECEWPLYGAPHPSARDSEVES